MSSVEVRPAGCHPECLTVSAGSHECNINMVGMTDPQRWRIDCDTCLTCVGASFLSREAAVEGAKLHVK